MSKNCCIIIGIIIGLARFLVHGSPLSWEATYEAFAHIFVGLLLGAGLFGRDRRTPWVVLSLLTALETIKFLTR
jgi:hypothetical protein